MKAWATARTEDARRVFARPRGAEPATTEPGATLFRRVRQQLALWYIGVLAGTLALFGVGIYGGVRQTLFITADRDLSVATHLITPVWQMLGYPECRTPMPPPPTPRTLAFLCYDARGTLVGANDTVPTNPNVTEPSLVARALHDGTATDTVNGGGSSGVFRRRAAVVRDARGVNVIGVVVVAASVQTELNALRVLLGALVFAGVVMLAVAALGGLFLSGRSLAPARLAFARQQAFIADAAHELRTPLTLLRADADVLLRARDRLGREDAALVEDIAAEARHMANLATAMLDLARLDAGDTHPERDVVDLAGLARDLVCRVTAYAQEAEIALSLAVDAPAYVLGDRTLLDQAALVLLDNAIKYNHPGGEVRVWVTNAGGQAIFDVCDTGVGIAVGDLPHLGERFYRADKARARETGGAGLGIAIARRIAALHGGSLHFTSTQGIGTTATLAFPALRETHREPISTL